MTGRAYNTFTTGINGVSAITGSNIMDIASIGIDLGLATADTTLLTDAYNRVHAEITVKNGIKADGIRADGSFGNWITLSAGNTSSFKLMPGQHTGILYNGNYGQHISRLHFIWIQF